MRFTPKTDKEIEEERLLPEGEYSFEVTQAVQYRSKAGNDMMKVMMKVFKPDGKHILITDYLGEMMLYKLKHFFDATGLQELYEAGEVHTNDLGEYEDLHGATGELKLGIQKSDDYPDRNNVKDYIPADGDKEKPKQNKKKVLKEMHKPLDDDMEDEIPF